jgi:hypothetical protein
MAQLNPDLSLARRKNAFRSKYRIGAEPVPLIVQTAALAACAQVRATFSAGHRQQRPVRLNESRDTARITIE